MSDRVWIERFEAGIRQVMPTEADPAYRDLWTQTHGKGWEGGPGTVATSSTKPHEGAQSCQVDLVPSGGAQPDTLYLNFRPCPGYWQYTREWSEDPALWAMNTFHQMRIWLWVPEQIGPPNYSGQHNLDLGTYVKSLVADGSNHSTGGSHAYHFFDVRYIGGAWHQLLFDMHPNHVVGCDPYTEWGVLEHPTLLDPTVPGVYDAAHNYFDCLTAWYLSFQGAPPAGPAPMTFFVDSVEMLPDLVGEDFDYVFSPNMAYHRESQRIYVSWHRKKNLDSVFDVKYAFSDIHELGWDAAAYLGQNIQSVYANSGGPYGTQYVDRADLDVGDHATLYVAIRCQGQTKFRQLVYPLTSTPPVDPPPSEEPGRTVTVTIGVSKTVELP
jgi:hypothetical protein